MRPPLLGEPARRPAHAPDRVVVVLALLPAGEQLAAAAGRLVLEPFGGGDDRQRGGRVDVHVVVADRGGDRARGAQHAPRDAVLAFEGVDRADQPLGDPDRGVGLDQLATELRRPRPLAALAEDVDEAGDAGDLGAGVAVGAAEVEGGVERLLGLAVVGAVVEDEAEALVELGGDRGEVVLERQGETAADRLQALLEVAALGLDHALQAERRGRRGRRARPARRLGGGKPGELDRLRVAGAAAMVVGHRQAFEGGVGGPLGGGEGLGGEAAGGEGLLPFAVRGRRPRPGAAAPRRTRAGRRGARSRRRARARLSSLRRARRPARRSGRSAAASRSAGPRPRPRARARAPRARPASRRGGRGPPRRPGRRRAGLAGAGVVAGAAPVGGDLEAAAAARLQAPRRAGGAGPGAGSRAPRRRAPPAPARGGSSPAPEPRSSSSADLDQLGQAGGGGELGGEIEVDLLADHRGRLGRFAGLGGEVGDADQHRFADRVGDRDLVALGELEPAAARPQRASARSARATSSSTKKGEPIVRSWTVRASAGEGASGSSSAEQLGDRGAVERLQGQLLEPAAAAQLVAQPAQPVVARQAVGAVGGDDQDRQLPQRLGQRGEQLERGLVGPLQVVEDEDQRPLAR